MPNQLLNLISYHLIRKHSEIDNEAGCHGLVLKLVIEGEIGLYFGKKKVRGLLEQEPCFEFKGIDPKNEDGVIYTFNLEKFLQSEEGKTLISDSIKKEEERLIKLEKELEEEIKKRQEKINAVKQTIIDYKNPILSY